MELLKKFPYIFSKQTGEGRYGELGSRSGVLGKPLEDGSQAQDEKKVIGT